MDHQAMAVAAAAPGVAGLAGRSSRSRKQIEPVFAQCAVAQFQVRGFRAGVLDIHSFWILSSFSCCIFIWSRLWWVGRGILKEGNLRHLLACY